MTDKDTHAFAAKHAPELAKDITRLCGSVITKGLTGILVEVVELHQKAEAVAAELAKSQPVEPVEPVAYMWHGHMGTGSKSLRFSKPSQWDYINAVAPLFTHPVRPMSDEDIVRIYEEVSHQKLRPQDKRIVFEVARAAIAKGTA